MIMAREYVPASLEAWKANLGIAQMRYKRGVTMSEKGSSRVARSVRQSRKQVVDLALQVSEAQHGVLRYMRSAGEAGEVELTRRLSDVWNSLSGSVECLFDAWAQLSAIEKELP